MENAQKAYALAMEKATSTHLDEIQPMRSELGSAQTAHDLEVEATRSKHQDEIDTMKLELEDIKEAHAIQIDEIKSAHNEELKMMESSLQNKIEKSWTLVNFMMKVLKKSEGLMKSREELILTQAAKLRQEETKVTESQKVIQGQRKNILQT